MTSQPIDPRATRDYFDGRAREYYQVNYVAPRSRHAFNLAMRRDICLALVPDAARRVLDLGCGPGAMAVPLAEQGRQVVAIDLSPGMVRQARALVHELTGRALTCAIGNASQVPFRDRAFDAVVTTGVLEYVADVPAALRDARRVLVPGGTLVASMTLPRRTERLAARLLARWQGRVAGPGQHEYTRAAFDAAVEAAGFAITARRISYYTPFPLDALAPRLVTLVDQHLGPLLERSSLAKDGAKTYVVAASPA